MTVKHGQRCPGGKMITEIQRRDVLLNCRSSLGLPGNQAFLDDVLLAGLLRRCAGIQCPCSRTGLRSVLVESLDYLDDNKETLSDRLDKLIDDLIVGGDLLELAEVATDNPDVKGTWVFAAPPSFIVRPSGTIFLTGIVPDQDMFLSTSLAARLIYEGCTRSIMPESGEELTAALSAQGMQQLSEAVWLRTPNTETPENLLGHFEVRLAAQSPCGTITNLEILDPLNSVTYYRGRWTTPGKHTGKFVGRRPQEFGAPIWCFVELADGVPERLIDLPLSGFRWRGCDASWHLQMAIDHCRGQPQRYRRRNTETTVCFDFFSPLPQWSQRRFIIFGKTCPREKSLLAYEIPHREAENEERFLQERLWLVRTEDNEVGV